MIRKGTEEEKGEKNGSEEGRRKEEIKEINLRMKDKGKQKEER